MTLWVILALMTAVALGAVIWPLARARSLRAAGSDLAVYRDQLEEIERDRADGRIGHDEFEAARVEVSRRLLAAANAGRAGRGRDRHGRRPAYRRTGGAAIGDPAARGAALCAARLARSARRADRGPRSPARRRPTPSPP